MLVIPSKPINPTWHPFTGQTARPPTLPVAVDPSVGGRWNSMSPKPSRSSSQRDSEAMCSARLKHSSLSPFEARRMPDLIRISDSRRKSASGCSAPEEMGEADNTEKAKLRLMGKGGGCFPSKNRNTVSSSVKASAIDRNAPIQEEENTEGSAEVVQPASSTAAPIENKLKIFIVFYSMYGHVESLAKKMKEGVDSIEGAQGILYRVEETLPQEVLEKMRAPPKDPAIPLISAAELTEADGILFGFPTRYGCMAAQMKAFFDSTGQLWREQKLAGKPAGFFVSTGSQGGGQETTIWTAITQLTHHGMLFVPIGYTFGSGMFAIDEIRGGSPYGAGVYAGDGSRQASEGELALAQHQGKYMASIVKKLAHA
ncbi:hypothetical protein ZIOFF_034112 [Zingiber officinale]|uniref:NAD(P)H dehydrogenase (quinone) n=3 Tax=Zingiber officinale TaxID=94328 RepID=A0A8J5LD29_ZINOF|nr:hypothetical protein ZIOFF_034112 [Zingiber officinale]